MLARWSSWGALPQLFADANPDWAAERVQLRELLSESEFAAARLTTINAHYTDAGYVTEMWEALHQLGFEDGDVLEPGAGSGTFIGMAPAGARMVGVELDPLTASIARGLYPAADIRTESFADSRFPRDRFDAVIGNVPFADARLYDPQFNGRGHSMHNHFIIKSLVLTRPGGVVMVLTSSFTLDAVASAARREMNEMADLVGAVRLPTGAHRRAAGTDAVTDLLILRRREDGQPPRDVAWEGVTAHEVDGATLKINAYFDMNPEHVLGDIHVGHGMHGQQTMTVTADLGTTAPALRTALADIVDRAKGRGEVFVPASTQTLAVREEFLTAQTDLWDGSLVATPDGSFMEAQGGALRPFSVPQARAKEMRSLLQLRDSARTLLEQEATTVGDSDELTHARSTLRRQYEAYVGAYGPLNRFTLRSTGKYTKVLDELTGVVLMDAATGLPVQGEAILARIQPPALARFKNDPYCALVKGLERFDDETQTAVPATILNERTVVPRVVKDRADTAADALALSMDSTGGADLALIAQLLEVEPAQARAALGTLVYDEPGTGALIPEPEYLSGDVRTKLEQAEAAALENALFQVNADALRAAIPDPIGIDQIEARLGSVWISPAVHQQFLSETLKDRTVRVENPLPGTWVVQGYEHSMLASNEWGTQRRSAIKIAEAVMSQQRIEVSDSFLTPEGRKKEVTNEVETAGAQEKAEALQERFSEWVWEDPARAAELAEIYNRKFNSIRLRDYSNAGDYLSLPGMASTITLRPHQRAAVARMIAEPTVGLFHQVGAGKTLEMVAGVTEMRRMGLVSKPAVVVPNHMLDQFSREWVQAYPNARILAASSKDTTAEKRRLFVARVAANDWDAVILTQRAFRNLSIGPASEQEYLERETEVLRAAKEAATNAGAGTRAVKLIEKAVINAETKLKKAMDIPRDPGVGWENTGIDHLTIDEAHMYKNLVTASRDPGVGIEGSQQALDLHMKLEYLRGRYGPRVLTMATATPIANSVTEAYVMQRYLRPDLMEAAGITSFDGWAATFGAKVTEMEMKPAGGFSVKSRFAKFQNVPEMLRMWHTFADVKTAEDLKLPLPLIAPRAGDGKREVETVVLEPTPELQEYIEQIAERAEIVGGGGIDPKEDNMLLISTDGRKAALDLRLVDESAAQTGYVKLDAVAARVVQNWQQTRHNVYTDTITKEISPIRGGLQLVFCDLGTPNDKRWDAYYALKGKLVAEGMDAESIRFIHEAKDDAAKARLFAAARSGHVAVLIGSTGKMGVGTNVQDRMTAMHHVDCPWRPADLEQRDGRGIRQGNQNEEIALYRYVVERSFDAYSWQTVARKATFIAQLMHGSIDSREVEDIGDTALSASEAKALASGNPLIMEKANADSVVQKLSRQRTAFERGLNAARHTQQNAQHFIRVNTSHLEQLREALPRTIDVSGEKFTMKVGESTYTSRADAGEAVSYWMRNHTAAWAGFGNPEPVVMGEIGGHTLTIVPDRTPASGSDMNAGPAVRLELRGVPLSGTRYPVSELRNAGVGLVRTLENKTTALPDRIKRIERSLVGAEETVAQAGAALSKVFPHAQALVEAKSHALEVTAALTASATPTPATGGADAGTAASTARSAASASYPPAALSRSSSPSPGQRTPRTTPSRDHDQGSGL